MSPTLYTRRESHAHDFELGGTPATGIFDITEPVANEQAQLDLLSLLGAIW
jgi:hypothetical protein